MSKEEITLLRDREWSLIDGEVCRATNFDDTISHFDKSLPYASITIECRKMPDKINGFITHKIDFLNLQKVFNEGIVKKGIEKGYTEVIIIWTRKHYKNILFKLASFCMPKLIVWICKKGAYEFINYPNHKPELQGEARFEMQKPIVEYKPEAML